MSNREPSNRLTIRGLYATAEVADDLCAELEVQAQAYEKAAREARNAVEKYLFAAKAADKAAHATRQKLVDLVRGLRGMAADADQRRKQKQAEARP